MCVALPGVVLKKRDTGYALVDFNGNKVEAKMGLVNIEEGDNVLVHAGCILQKVSNEEAKVMKELMEEMSAFE